MLTTSCPQYFQTLTAADELIGKTVKCNYGHSFVLQSPLDPPRLIERPGVEQVLFARRLWPRVRL
jgi:hypothetical protein